MKELRISNAPCSWGIEFADAPNNPVWNRVLDEMSEAGYQATELGPYGYLPTDVQLLKNALNQRHLSIIAGTLFKYLHQLDKRKDIVVFTRKNCELLQAVGAQYMVIIDHVSSPRTDQAGQIKTADRLPLAQWKGMMQTIDECAGVCLDHGITPVLHPHTGTYIEYLDETERAMNDLTIDRVKLCVDTGHCYYAGMDPAQIIRTYGDRVAYMHFKDVNAEVHKKVIENSIDFYNAIAEGVFCPLGEGDLDFDSVYAALADIGYEGWITVEQDTDPLRNDKPMINAQSSLKFIQNLHQAA